MRLRRAYPKPIKMSSFNPRICKRCDHAAKISIQEIKGFNPRICKRCDYTDEFCDPFKRVSIHASVKDATDHIGYQPIYIKVSIHASVKDATMPMMFPIQTKMFQSTHL